MCEFVSSNVREIILIEGIISKIIIVNKDLIEFMIHSYAFHFYEQHTRQYVRRNASGYKAFELESLVTMAHRKSGFTHNSMI